MKLAFCLNSKRWLVFMDLRGSYPKTCPCRGRCYEEHCGYIEEREPTSYFKRRERIIQSYFGEEESCKTQR